MKKTILLIDDDEVIHYLLQRACRTLEVTVNGAMNGSLALEYFKRWYREGADLPDIVLVDINMPVMGGFEFIDAVQALSLEYGLDSPPCRFHMFTSSEAERDVVRAEALAWVESYVVKPLDIAACADIVQRLIS